LSLFAAKHQRLFGEDCRGEFGPNAAALLADDWLQSLKVELREGPVLVNSAGGFVARRDLIVPAEIETDALTWPMHFADEIIVISKWPKGKHCYLSSNQERIFLPEKFETYQAAKCAALKYVLSDRIKSRL
jgi:hypothetical protein